MIFLTIFDCFSYSGPSRLSTITRVYRFVVTYTRVVRFYRCHVHIQITCHIFMGCSVHEIGMQSELTTNSREGESERAAFLTASRHIKKLYNIKVEGHEC